MKDKLLVLDDDALIQQVIKLSLSKRFDVLEATSYDQAIKLLESEQIDCAIIDIDLKDPNHTGLDFLEKFRQKYQDKPALVQSGYRDVPIVVKSMQMGADDYLEKPFDEATLHMKVDKVFSDTLKMRVLKRAYDKSLARHTIIGETEGIRKARMLVEQAQDMRILLYGETGVGKTPFAVYSNRILSNLQKQERPFEQVNCACLSSEQFLDQLFGHKKGAFTGAFADKRGLVEIAQGGDLFLDEIGDMPLETQAHFLTFLDSMEYYRLGDDKKRRASVRVISATNKDLKKMVAEGKFRQDLYSRISQVVIEIPPLRNRVEDIRLLFSHFVTQFVGVLKPYDEEIINIFQKFGWEEGNVRELRDAVEYIVMMSRDSKRIEVEHLSDRYRPVDGKAPQSMEELGSPLTDLSSLFHVGLDSFLDRMERTILERTVRENQTSLEVLAKELKLSRPTLYRRLKKYDISSPRFDFEALSQAGQTKH